MASDNLRGVGKYIRQTNKQADLALKRVRNRIPKRERARDTVSSLYPFTMTILTENSESGVSMDVNFNKPPPSDCSSECISTSCESFELYGGGYSLTMENPYEAGSVNVFSQGVPLAAAQWFESNPGAGQVYVQVQNQIELIIICYSYVIC